MSEHEKRPSLAELSPAERREVAESLRSLVAGLTPEAGAESPSPREARSLGLALGIAELVERLDGLDATELVGLADGLREVARQLPPDSDYDARLHRRVLDVADLIAPDPMLDDQ